MVELAHGESEASYRVLRGLATALAISVVVLGVEAVGAWFSHSLSVTVDAVHNLPDLFAFTISYLALAGTAVGRSDVHTFGSHRQEVFAAILNAFVILATGLLFAYPALLGLVHGAAAFGPVDAQWVLFAALPTLALRVASAAYLGRIPRQVRDLNVGSVLLHLASDIAITLALVVEAGLLLLYPAAAWVDSAAALFVAGVLVYESIPIFQGGWEVLTERVPHGLSLGPLREAIESVPRVRQVHDLHVWALCPTLVCMTAHVEVDEMPMSEGGAITSALRKRVEDEFGIVHSVFELETGSSGSRARLSPTD